MAENQALLTGRSKAITAVEDFAIGPAHPQGQGAYQNGAIGLRRFRDLLEPCRAGDAGQNGDCTHRCLGLPRLRSLRRPQGIFGASDTPAAPSAVAIPLYAGRRKMFRRVATKAGPPALWISDGKRGTIWRPLDAGDGQFRRALSPPKAPIPTASWFPTKPHASSTPPTMMPTSPLRSSSPTA